MDKEQLIAALDAKQRKIEKLQEKIDEMARYRATAYTPRGAIAHQEKFADRENAEQWAEEHDRPDALFNPTSARIEPLKGA